MTPGTQSEQVQTLAPVTSTQEVSGKRMKQEPESSTDQRHLQVALLYVWDGARAGSKIEGGVARD